MAEHDPLRTRFAAYRQELTVRVDGPGPDAARRTLRRRRRAAVAAGAAVAVALVVAPIAATAALRRDAPPPVPPAVTPTPTPPTPTPSASPSVRPSPPPTSRAPKVPDGRISERDLLAARLDLPAWRPGPGCPDEGARMVGEATRDGTNVLEGLAYGDVDGDGATETVALVHCLLGTGGPAQVVAFDRNEAGEIVTMGRVVATSRDKPQWLVDVEVRSGGLVRVQVADLAPGGGWPGEWSQRQWRGYRWEDGRFGQAEGPTSFPRNPYSVNLAVTASDLVLTGNPDDGTRSGTVEVRIRNLDGRAADAVAVTLDLPAVLAPDGDGWAGCGPDVGAYRPPLRCLTGRIAAGGNLTLRLGLRLPKGATLAAGRATVAAQGLGPGLDHLLETDLDDNQVTIGYR
ncbi:hypothetical protein AB0J20_17050 [Micromonospora costi]|uniref:hypothetical protein n=1 Tax=Micromonospora costi TaxID=1530042 RepID=UPI0033E40706